jgi:hypothetical protein
LYCDDTFLIESKKEILNNDKIPLTTLCWEYPNFKERFGHDVGQWEQEETFRIKNKVEPSLNNFWISMGFSEQFFVASVDKLKKMDYNLQKATNPFHAYGPPYCPTSWEKRVAHYIYNNDQYRGIWKNTQHYYKHPHS